MYNYTAVVVQTTGCHGLPNESRAALARLEWLCNPPPLIKHSHGSNGIRTAMTIGELRCFSSQEKRWLADWLDD
jgi:hypothetical protein